MGKLAGYLIAFFTVIAAPRADWQPTGMGDGTGAISELHADGNFILAKSDHGFSRTLDHGRTWSYLPSPVDSGDFSMAWVGPAVFLVSTKGSFNPASTIWRSLDSAKTWSPLPPPPDSLREAFGYVSSLFGSGRFLLAGAVEGAFRSSDSGNTWSRVKLPDSVYEGFLAFAFSGPLLYAESAWNTWVSADSGGSWSVRCRNLVWVDFSVMAGNGKVLLGAGRYAYISRLGERDTAWNTDTSFIYPAFNGVLVAQGSDFFTAKGDTVLRTTDNGVTWNPIGRMGFPVRSMAVDGAALLAGTEHGGIYRSTDGGVTWNRFSVSDAAIRTLTARGGNLYAEFSGGGGLYRSGDRGGSWAKVLDWIKDNGLGTAMAEGFNVIGNGMNLYATGTALGELKRSRDGGVTWESHARGFKRLFQSGSLLFAEKQTDLYRYPLHRSVDSGSTWTPITEYLVGNQLLTMGSLLISAKATNSARSRDGGATWEQFPVNLDKVSALAACGKDVFAASSVGLARSSDSGSTWGLIRADMTDVTALYSDGSVLFAGRSPANPVGQEPLDPKGARILRSTDQGVTWTPVSEGFISVAVTSLEAIGTDLFAGTGGAGVWKRPLSEMGAGAISIRPGSTRASRPGRKGLIGKDMRAVVSRPGSPLRDVNGRAFRSPRSEKGL